MPIFIGRGAPVYRGTLAYPDLRQGSRSHPAPLFAALVTGKWNMALKVHSVVEDAHDFDRALWRGPVHQEVTSATTVSRNVERTKTWHDLVSSLRAHDIGTVGKFANRLDKRVPIDARLPRAKILSGPFEDICEVEFCGNA
jgi:hypothetical protein